MVSLEQIERIRDHWASSGILCNRVSIRDHLEGSDFSLIWQAIGMPLSPIWLFRFAVSLDAISTTATSIQFGTLGTERLLYRIAAGTCHAIGEDGVEYFANSSFVLFVESLVAFDRQTSRIVRDFSGDSQEDEDQADLLLEKLAKDMKEIDPPAFERDTNFWPWALDHVRC